MALNLINRGSTANDGTGDNLRAGAEKVNANFTEIYTALGSGTVIDGTIKFQDDSSTQATISANGEVIRVLGGSGITSSISGNDLTLAVDGTISTASGSQTLTNKTINGPDNTLTNIANGSLSNSTITVSDGSNSTARALGSTLTIQGTSNEIEVAASSGTLTVGLPHNVTISGNLSVQGTTTTINSTSIEITNSFTFEGATSDGHETILTVVDPTADRTVSIPNATGTIVLKDTTDTLTNKTINGPDNTITNLANANLSGSAGITNANLANSAVTLGATSVSLGSTAASASNFNLSGTSSLSGTGTVDTTGSGNKLRFNFANTGSFPTASTYEGMFAYDVGGNHPYVADAGGWVKILTENASIADISNVGSIGSISNGQALLWNASGGRFDPGDVLSNDFANANAQDLGYLSYRSSSNTPTKTLTVTVATQTAEHYYNGTGSSNKYVIDGDQGPFLSMAPGIYRFDTSDSSNGGHPLLFYRDAAKATAYTTGVTTNGTPGSAGAYTQITINKDTPQVLYYQCSSHAYMGHALVTVGSEVSFGASNGFAIAMSIAL